jgi:hypothetical protein
VERESVARVSVPGYEILGKLGEGGMGVVYRARQAGADRVVALKMILAGGHANADALTRFRTEAQAIARLQHPNIVQIYEVGEHDGLPFFSLEFCAGGSLDRKLNGTPLPPREAAALVERLARAVQAAHQQHIIHRDLKPANVLLTADGTPKITDFGLAKKLDAGAGPTVSNAVMGTPSYMAPEQAAGKGAEVGPAADVYALGAILYECLVGRPPFRAATVFDTLMQVLSDEPVPPGQLQSSTPRDLETICLKCLRKEPAKRYLSTAELAEDLRRFLAGEPIQARPVGVVERAVKWVKRRPAVAGLLAGMVLVLVLGTVVSTYFAFEADRRAKDADASATVARAKEKEAREREEEARDEKQRADEARAQVEATLARSLLRPLGHQEEGGVNGIEWDALWELAESPSDRVRLLFVEQALEGPRTLGQLRTRREVALHAAVGLDSVRRRQLVGLLLGHFRERGTDPRVLIDHALVALEVVRPGEDPANEVAGVLADVLARETDLPVRAKLAQVTLPAAASRMGPAEATEAARRLTDALLKATDPLAMPAKETNQRRVRDLAFALSAVAAKMDPADPDGLGPRLSDALGKASDNYTRSMLAGALAGTTFPIRPELARRLTDELAKTPDPYLRAFLAANVLAKMANRMEAATAAAAAQGLTDALAKETDHSVRRALVVALSAVAARMGPIEAVAAARRLLDALAKETNPYMLPALSDAFAAVAARTDSAEAARLAAEAGGRLTDALARATDSPSQSAVALALSAVVGQMERTAAARLATTVIRQLTEALAKEKYPYVRPNLVDPLVAMAAWVGSAEAAEAARLLTDALAKETDPIARPALACAVAAVAGKMDSAEAARLTAETALRLLDALAGETNSNVRSALAGALSGAPLRQADSLAQLSVRSALVGGLSGVACCLGPDDAAEAARRLTDVLTKEMDPRTQRALANALAAVAGRMGPVEETAAARRLLDALAKETNPDMLSALSDAFAAVAAKMEPADAAEVARRLANTLSRETNAFTLSALAHALAAVAAKVGPTEAAPRTGEAARLLTDALAKTTDPGERNPLADALAAVASRMEPAEVARLLTDDVLSKNTNPDVLAPLAGALAAVAARMEPAEAARLSAEMARRLTDVNGIGSVGVPRRMGPGPRWYVVDSLRLVCTQAGQDGSDPRPVLAAQAVAVWTSPSPHPGHAAAFARTVQPLPCRLTTQQLVELLKRPTCVGPVRTVILELLGQRYGRTFADQWEFVDYAHEHLPDLDLTTPPKRAMK